MSEIIIQNVERIGIHLTKLIQNLNLLSIN